MCLVGQFRDAAKIQFSLRTAALNTLRNHRPELLVKTKSPLSQFIRFERSGQLRHGLSHIRQSIQEFALQVSFNTTRVNGLGFDHRPQASLWSWPVTLFQGDPPEIPHLVSVPAPFEFFRARLKDPQPLALALCVQTCQSPSK